MKCRVCNSRLGPDVRFCLNCGQGAPPERAFRRSSAPAPLPSADLSTARDSMDDQEFSELLDRQDELAPKPKRSANKKAKPAPKKAAKPRGKKLPWRRSRQEPDPDSSRSSYPTPDPAGLRTLLAEMPETLEPGLEVYRNESGRLVGASYVSGVGDIDLLARDANGDLVVVMISRQGEGEELIAQVLERIGWVRKHIGEGGEQVRGIVLCEEAPEGLSYAASAVAGTVSFKTYRIGLAFQDIEI